MLETKHREIGIGMLGCGWMGKAHSNAYNTLKYMRWPNSYVPRLVMIGGIDEKESSEAAERFGYSSCCAGWDAIVKNPEVKIFDNCSPDKLHVIPTIEAAKSGKHVICEKPLAVGREDAKKMLDAVNAGGVKHMCCFSYRFFPAVRLAYELIQKGALGKIYHFSGKYHQDQGSVEEVPVEDVWYINWSGIAQGITSHMIDMSRFLVGELAAVTGMVSTYNKVRNSKNGPVEVKADEGFFSMVEFENGATGTYESLGVAHGKRNQFAFEIYGSKGSVMFDLQEPNYLKVFLKDTAVPEVVGFTNVQVTEPNHPFMNIWWPKGHVLGWEHGHINMIDHFLECVVNEKEVSPLGGTFEDGYKVAVVIDTIKESAQLGKRTYIKY